MQDENSNNLENLINNIKSQPPLIPLEDVAKVSKGFFSASKSLYQNWMRPAGIAAVGAIIIALTFLFANKPDKNEMAKDTTFKRAEDDSYATTKSNPTTADTLPKEQSSSINLLPTKNESVKNDIYWNTKDETSQMEIVEIPERYQLTRKDSAVINSFSAEVQTFQIDPLCDNVITGKLGTTLVFYKACFEDSMGNVAKSTVNISLKECYHYPDMVKENLNTHCDSGYLESKGMIWVDAKSDEKTLKLREGFDVPIEFASDNTEDYNLYYANGDKYTETNWELDSLGKVPNPVIFANGGRYWDKMFHYFQDNYKMDKATMLSLYGKSWYLHFTSSNTKMIGYTACNSNEGEDLNIACYKFRDLCENIYEEVPYIKRSSWLTGFDFACISRDSLNRWLANDTIQRKVKKAVFGVTMRSPFYASNLGWINCDHPIRYKLSSIGKQVVTLNNYPKDGYTQTYLLLKDKRSIANPGRSNSGPVFYNLPRNSNATLFSYKLMDGKISYLQMDLNTSTDSINLGAYEPITDADALIAKIEELTSSYLE